jgi:lipopolysaccharide/colanic/teichoic acid biosynthesis glycosyltransferase
MKVSRHVPLLRRSVARVAVGGILLVLSAALPCILFHRGRVEFLLGVNVIAWVIAVFLTHKYTHKYPQRYYTYLIAAHFKAATIMAFFLGVMGWAAGSEAVPQDVLWIGYAFFIIADVLVSLPRRRDIPGREPSELASILSSDGSSDDAPGSVRGAVDGSASVDKEVVTAHVRADLDDSFVKFIEDSLPDARGGESSALVLDDIPIPGDKRLESDPVHVLVGRRRLNDVLRFNQFMQYCTGRIAMGGYFVVRYRPLEHAKRDLKRRYRGVLYRVMSIVHVLWYRAFPKIPWLHAVYFSPPMSWLDTFCLSLTKGRNRILSRAELWGRLAYYGMDVIAEDARPDEAYVVARRVTSPVEGRRPSYYPVVGLEKVALDGKTIRVHKIRTMFPFSEFIQKRLYEDQGLTASGKFAGDFRLTEFGKFLRRYWLDEFPQILDWLRGDIKLVGIRATSRHFLSLYPKEFLELYVQVKPGLIPPLFSESTSGFDQIVEIEFAYLRRYWKSPFATDVRYLVQTFTDIIFRGVRSR